MNKRRIVLLAIGVIVLFTIVYYVFFTGISKKVEQAAFTAIPLDAAFVVETKNFREVVHQLVSGNKMWSELSHNQIFANVNKQLVFLDSLLDNNKKARNTIDDNLMLISSHLRGKENADFLYVLSMDNESDGKEAVDALDEILDNKAIVSKRTYNNVKIYDANFTQEAAKQLNAAMFSFTTYKSVFLLSFSSILVDDALRQLESQVSLMSSKSFQTVLKASEKSADANIFLNYKMLPEFFANALNETYEKRIKSFNNFADWSELDISLKEDELQMTGFTLANDSSNHYLYLFQKQEPTEVQVAEILPNNTSNFVALEITNPKQFLPQYKAYLQQNDVVHIYLRDIQQVKTDYEVDYEFMMYSILENEICVAFTEQASTVAEHGKYAIVKTKDSELATDELLTLLKNYAKKSGKPLANMLSTYKASDNNVYKIYQMPVAMIMNKLFGELFLSIPTDYFTFIENYLVFSDSPASLQSFINSYSNKATLANADDYKDFTSLLWSKSNYLFYSNLARSPLFFGTFTKEEIAKMLNKSSNIAYKFNSLGIQFRSDNEVLHTNIALKYKPVYTPISRSLWSAKLDSVVIIKPQIVVNHNTKDKEVVVQDAALKLYLFDNTGKRLWSKKLTEPITSDIYQIDYLLNSKFQLYFATKTELHLIDRNGDYVEPYPIKLPAGVTNRMTLYDYDNKRDYRIFVACSDKKVYCFDKNGRQIDGWKFSGTEEEVFSKVQHFAVQGKDYIVFSDKSRTYIVDRQGKERVKLESNFARSVNNDFYLEFSKNQARLVTTATDGTIQLVYLDGKVGTIDAKSCGTNHYFDLLDVDNDGNNDFIFVDDDQLTVSKLNEKTLFSYEFKEAITCEPTFYLFPQNAQKIGITSIAENQIYLFNQTGTLYEGFPLAGNSLFSIGYISNKKNLNLVVGNASRLVCYELQAAVNQ